MSEGSRQKAKRPSARASPSDGRGCAAPCAYLPDEVRQRLFHGLCVVRFGPRPPLGCIETAQSEDVRELIGPCVALATAIDAERLGYPPGETERWLPTVIDAAERIAAGSDRPSGPQEHITTDPLLQQRGHSMKCETCEKEFSDATVKVWNGKKVCPGCFETLNDAQSAREPPLDTTASSVKARAEAVVIKYLGGRADPINVGASVAEAAVQGLAAAIITVAAELGISLNDGQLLTILANNDFPGRTKVATPLTPEERAVAVEVKYRWWKNRRDKWARDDPRGATGKTSDATLREMAAHEVQAAEIGRATGAGQLAHKVGCSVVLALVTACSAMAAAMMVGVAIVRGH